MSTQRSAAALEELRDSYDVVVVGGGPAGTTFGQLMRRSGQTVLVVERSRHPRFSVGESLLPGSTPVWRELGLLERFEAAGFVRKYGAYFCFESGLQPEYFHFADATRARAANAYEVPRSEFDRLLWDAAVDAGVACLDETAVERFCFEGDRATGVELLLRDGTHRRVAARLVADCSGRATLLGRQLGTRERDRRLDKVALYCHYGDVIRSTGDDAGTIAIVATSFGWMWLIPFAGGSASVGAVIERAWYAECRKDGKDNEEIWQDILTAVPAVAHRLVGAERIRPLEATADFQYRVRPIAGDGWVLVGDAGGFVDPVFSSGVHLAMTGARRAGRAAASALKNGRLPRKADFARYARATDSALRVYSKFIYAWYDPDFRAVFLRPPHGRIGVDLLKREILSILAGAELPAWRALPSIYVLLLVARVSRHGEPPT